MKLTTIAKQILGRQTPNAINEGQVLKGMVDGKPTYIIEHDGQELRVSEKDWKAFKDMISLKESVVSEDSAGRIELLKTGIYKDTKGRTHTLKAGQIGRHERIGWDGDFVHFGNLVFDANTFGKEEIEVYESVVTEAKNTIGLAFKEEQDYLDFKEFVAEQPRGAIKKDFGWDSKTKSWEVIMDVKVLDDIYGEGTPANRESGWYGALPDDFESVIIESVVTEDSKDIMIKQIERALKGGDSIFKLPMATQKYYNKNKSDFQVNLSSEEYQKVKKLKAFKQHEWKWNGDTQLWTKKQK